jgi:hypothetical protein
MKPNRPRSPSSGEAVRVTSRDPRGDARLLGHESATPRTVLDERNAVLRRRFVNLLADGTSGALGAAQRDHYRAQILVQVARAYERIADDLTALEAATDGVQRRDQIMRATVEGLMAMAELSTGRASGTSTWAEALVGLRGYIEHLVAAGTDDAATLIAIDLGVERIEYVEKLAGDAMRSYRGYILA